MNYNKVIIAGRVCQTPEIKTLPSGIVVCNFSLAINSYSTTKDTNEKKETVEFVNVIFFGKQAETIGQYVVKGQILHVDGRLQTRTWEDSKDGSKKSRTEVVGNTFQFGEKPKDADTKRTGEMKAQGIPVQKSQPQDIEAALDSMIDTNEIPF